MSDWVIHKFGGSCLRIPGDIIKIEQRILESLGKPIVVVSALWGVTDRLLRATREPWQWSGLVNDLRRQHSRFIPQVVQEPLFEEVLKYLAEDLLSLCHEPMNDAVKASVLASGERLASITLSTALREKGLDCKPIAADELGIIIAENGAAINIEATSELLNLEKLKEGIPIISGWFGKNTKGEIKVLDRGGSDLSAAALARILDAKQVVLWKDVPGVLSISPRWGIESNTIPYLGHEEALALARAGGIILHASCIEPLKGTGIPCIIRSLHDDSAKTVIGPDMKTENKGVTAISCVPGMIHYSIKVDGHRTASTLDSMLNLLKDEAVKVWSLSAGEGHITMFIPSSMATILEKTMESIEVKWQKSKTASLISLIGRSIEIEIENALHYIQEECAFHMLTDEEDLRGLMLRLSNKFKLLP
jgi:aspartate kinase